MTSAKVASGTAVFITMITIEICQSCCMSGKWYCRIMTGMSGLQTTVMLQKWHVIIYIIYIYGITTTTMTEEKRVMLQQCCVCRHLVGTYMDTNIGTCIIGRRVGGERSKIINALNLWAAYISKNDHSKLKVGNLSKPINNSKLCTTCSK